MELIDIAAKYNVNMKETMNLTDESLNKLPDAVKNIELISKLETVSVNRVDKAIWFTMNDDSSHLAHQKDRNCWLIFCWQTTIIVTVKQTSSLQIQ